MLGSLIKKTKLARRRENSKKYLEENQDLLAEIKEKILINRGLIEAPVKEEEVIHPETGEILEETKPKKKAKKIQ